MSDDFTEEVARLANERRDEIKRLEARVAELETMHKDKIILTLRLARRELRVAELEGALHKTLLREDGLRTRVAELEAALDNEYEAALLEAMQKDDGN